MKRLAVLAAVTLTSVFVLTACGTSQPPAQPTCVSVDVDRHKGSAKPKYPTVKKPSFRKPSTGKRR